MNLINEIENNQLKADLPELNSGDSVKVNVKVSEGNRERIQTFEGVEVYIHNGDSSLLNGLELDFKDTLMGGGFNITNPNASRECGCGQSFG